jgi:hypothetical protein
MSYRISAIVLCLLIMSLASLTLVEQAANVNAQGNFQSLPAGSWWSLSYTEHRTLSGTGSDSGSWAQDASSTYKLSVDSTDGKTMVISEQDSGTYSSVATDHWVGWSGGATNQGTYPQLVVHYTIDLTQTGFKVTSVSNTSYVAEVGHPPWFLADPATFQQGQSVERSWYDGSNTRIYVPWMVTGSQSVKVGSVDVTAWRASYTGESAGYWQSGTTHTYAKGPESDAKLYAALYGIEVAATYSGNYALTESGGGWTETFDGSIQTTGTNIVFSSSSSSSFASSSSSVSSSPLALGGNSTLVIGAVVAAIVLAMGLVGTRMRKGRAASKISQPVPASAQQSASQGAGERFCGECGHKLGADEEFCGECGAKQ